jgi:WD40 repeat protein
MGQLQPPFVKPLYALPDLPDPALIRTLSGHTADVNGCAISADGALIVSASDDNTLKVWDAHTAALLRTLSGHTSRVTGYILPLEK